MTNQPTQSPASAPVENTNSVALPSEQQTPVLKEFWHHIENPTVDLKFFNELLRSFSVQGLVFSAVFFINNRPPSWDLTVVKWTLGVSTFVLFVLTIMQMFFALAKLAGLPQPKEKQKSRPFLKAVFLGLMAVSYALSAIGLVAYLTMHPHMQKTNVSLQADPPNTVPDGGKHTGVSTHLIESNKK